MTVSSQVARVSYAGNGSTKTFAVPFYFLADGHLRVIARSAAGVETVYALTTNYAVTGAGNPSGGSITLASGTAAPASGETLVILRNVPLTQETDYQANDPFPAESHEQALDKLTMENQNQQLQIDRALKVSETDPTSVSTDLPSSIDRAGTVLAFDETGTPVAGPDVASVGTVLANIENINIVAGIDAEVTTVAGIASDVTTVAGIAADVTTVAAIAADVTTVAENIADINTVADNIVDVTNFADVYLGPKTSDPAIRNDGSALQNGDLYFNTTSNQMRVYGGGTWSPVTAQAITITQNAFTGNGTTTAFTLSDAPVSKNNIIVEVGGVIQTTDAYTVSGTTLTFSAAPANGVAIETRIIATVNNLNSAHASAVTFNQAGSGAVTRDVETKLREFASVKDFGAVGDGVTDDTAAIQAALNSGASAVRLPAGNYSVSSLNVASNTIVFGDGYSSRLTARGTGNPINVIGIPGGTKKENVSIRDLRFVGLSNAPSNILGCGVLFQYARAVSVERCYFDNFGGGAGDLGGIAIHFHIDCTDITVKDNTVVNGSGTNNGSDIAVYSASGYAIITGNRCYSRNSNGIYTNSTSTTGKVIISNNICANHTRHGIIPVYGGTSEMMDVSITGNICIDCDSTGIYINSNASGFTVTGNIIESCSGGGTNGYVLSGGIVLIGAGKKICTSNYINNTGKTTAGVTRTIVGMTNDPTLNSGIRVNQANGTIVANNIVKDSTGRGIECYLGTMQLSVIGNRFENCAAYGIFTTSTYVAGQKAISIKDNIVDQYSGDGHGLYVQGGSGVEFMTITGNSCFGAKAGTNKHGFHVESQGFKGQLCGNVCTNWDYAFYCATGSAAINFGNGCDMDRNQFVNSTTGMYYIPPTTPSFAFHSNTVRYGNTTDDVDAYGYGTFKRAKFVYPFKEFYSTSAPTAATWAQGDRAIRETPTVGQPKAWVCTVSGTPGTWVSEGNL